MLTVGDVSSTTVTVFVTTVWLPAWSRAVTVTETSPSVLVSSSAPSATLPTQDASPEPPVSAQLKSTSSGVFCFTCEPFAGLRRSTVGGTASQPVVPVTVIR